MLKLNGYGQRCNQLQTPHGLLFLIFYVHHPTDSIAHTMAPVKPIVYHWLEQTIPQ